MPQTNFYLRVIKFVFIRLATKSLLVLSFFVPEKKGLIVFSMSRGRYWDNSRALFEYMAKSKDPDLRLAWLSDPELPRENIPTDCSHLFFPRHSFRGWLLCARAQCIVICYSYGDFGIFREVAKRKITVMLWHAITTKYCGILDEKFNQIMRRTYVRKETAFYDRLVVSSDIDRYYSASYTGMDVNRILVTGLPRNDKLFCKSAQKKRDRDRFSILYAPTFRDYPIEGGSVLFPFCKDERELVMWAMKAGIVFNLRPHPSDKESLHHVDVLTSTYPKLFIDSRVERAPDVVDLIIRCDAIITDYSSTYIDALALDRPVVFVDYDRQQYVEKRGLAYGYDLITPGPKVRDFHAFKRACEEMVLGAEAWAVHREFVRKMFFKYRDENACSRVAAMIKEIIAQ